MDPQFFKYYDLESVVASSEGITIDETLSDREKSYYLGLFEMMTNHSGEDKVYGAPFYDLVKSSGLKRIELAHLWRQCAAGSLTSLTRLEFLKFMRCIALAQNGYSDIDSNNYLLLCRNFPYIAEFEDINLPLDTIDIHKPRDFQIGDENDDKGKNGALKPEMAYPSICLSEFEEYEQFVEKAKTEIKGVLQTKEAKHILKASRLSNKILYQIWGLCEYYTLSKDKSKDYNKNHRKCFLKRNEFIVALHIIRKAKIGYPVPKKMPKNLLNFLDEYEEKKMCLTGFMDSNHPEKSRESINIEYKSEKSNTKIEGNREDFFLERDSSLQNSMYLPTKKTRNMNYSLYDEEEDSDSKLSSENLVDKMRFQNQEIVNINPGAKKPKIQEVESLVSSRYYCSNSEYQNPIEREKDMRTNTGRLNNQNKSMHVFSQWEDQSEQQQYPKQQKGQLKKKKKVLKIKFKSPRKQMEEFQQKSQNSTKKMIQRKKNTKKKPDTALDMTSGKTSLIKKSQNINNKGHKLLIKKSVSTMGPRRFQQDPTMIPAKNSQSEKSIDCTTHLLESLEYEIDDPIKLFRKVKEFVLQSTVQGLQFKKQEENFAKKMATLNKQKHNKLEQLKILLEKVEIEKMRRNAIRKQINQEVNKIKIFSNHLETMDSTILLQTIIGDNQDSISSDDENQRYLEQSSGGRGSCQLYKNDDIIIEEVEEEEFESEFFS